MSERGFYDQDEAGAARPVRNDRSGNLPAMVQFAQNHTVDPSGNEAKNMPRLTMSREAMVLVTPDPSLGDIASMQLQVTLNGQAVGTLTLRAPSAIFRSDYNDARGRPDYVYTRRAWTGVLPWQWVQPGMALRAVDSAGRSGSLTANAIDFAGAAELVVQSLRLGMLSAPPGSSNNQWFLVNPADAATDYFQTVPIAKLTVGSYEDVQLSRVMVASGVIYTATSADAGAGVYSGDMRENTAKSTFSTGINLANTGVTSAGMRSQDQPHVFQQATAHHAQGSYQGKVVSHGLSGGNGILTLYATRGNEFSHEIGHHYGLGHYPGQSGDNYFWAAHHHDSGWGFIGYRKRMRANIYWNAINGGGCDMKGVPRLDATYCFNTDSMSGGHYNSALSNYAHYTGYSTKLKIQPALAKPVLNPASPTGYSQWNASTRQMENVAPKLVNQSAVWNNTKTGVYMAPRQTGVPVITLLGGYDPDNASAVMYPALRGNWGNVFDLPSASVTAASDERQCWLDVGFADGHSQRIALAGKRMQANSVNKFHVNLAQADKPNKASLSCQAMGGAVQQLDSISIRTDLPAMAPPVVVGKEAGYAALRQQELPELETALQALAGKTVLTLSVRGQLLVDSWGDDVTGLSPAAQAQLARFQAQHKVGERLNHWMSFYGSELAAGDVDAQNALLAFIGELGLMQSPLVPRGDSLGLSLSGGMCLQKTGDAVRVAAQSLCTGDANERWVMDGRGRIRSRADLSLCLVDNGTSRATLAACSDGSAAQVWDISVANRITRGGRCMDLKSGFLTNGVGELITYSCTGGGNQKWTGLTQSNSLLLALISSENAARLDALSLAQKATRMQAAGPSAAQAGVVQAEQAQAPLAQQQAASSWQQLLAGLQRWWRQLFA